MSETIVELWFDAWLLHHQGVVPHAAWREPIYNRATDEGRRFFAGWIAEFDRLAIMPDEAKAASYRLQLDHPGYPEHHLKPLLAAIRAIRRDVDGQASDRDRRERLARIARERAEAAAFRQRWQALTDSDRADRLARVLDRFPALRYPRAFAECLAIRELNEESEQPAAVRRA